MTARDARGRFVAGRGVTSTDHGYDALLKRVFEFGRPQIAMGILEKDGGEEHNAEPGEENEEPVTILQVAEWLEFGTVDQPPRSFIRAWWDEASPEMRHDLATLMQGVVKGTRSKEQILELLGLKGQAGIQKRMADGLEPPNAESTIRKKGSSKPGIDTGQVRSAVSYAVREGEEE